MMHRYLQILAFTLKRNYVKQDETGNAKKRRAKYTTFQKWQRKHDRECQTMSWLHCTSEIDNGKKVMSQLKCKVCTDFADRICSSKNFSNKWIVRANSVRINKVHAQSNHHGCIVLLFRKQQANSAGLPPPILCFNCSELEQVDE